MVASVGYVNVQTGEEAVLVVGPSSVTTEALVTRLAQQFDSLSISAPSNLEVTLNAVGYESIDVAVINRYEGQVTNSSRVRELCESEAIPTAVIVEPDATVDVPSTVTIVEREDEWLPRLESWVDAQLGETPALSGTGSAREQYERMLENQNDRLREFTGVISHELRNPLGVLSDRAELIKMTGETDHADAIIETAGNMEAFLEDLLDLARQGQVVGDPHPLDIEAVARDAWAETVTHEATLTIEEVPTVVAGPDRLQELFTNLFANAVEHAGPDVSITVGPLTDGFYVADDGPGIPEENRSDVFDHGYTTEEDGTGFGLSIVEAIVSAHGWEITLKEGFDGACFAISGVETRDGCADADESHTDDDRPDPRYLDPEVADTENGGNAEDE